MSLLLLETGYVAVVVVFLNYYIKTYRNASFLRKDTGHMALKAGVRISFI